MFEDPARPDLDRCLGELPATGGSLRNIICPVTLASQDTVDALYEPAAGPDGRLLYLREASLPGLVTPLSAALVLADPADPLAGTVVQAYPYTAANGVIHSGISNVHWLSSSSAIYLAERVDYVAPCSSCPIDTLRTGLELVRVDLSGATPTTQIIPNTSEASSVDVAPGGDLIYFTRNGDGRVYQMTLADGTTSIVHDFGTGEIARDAHVVGNRLYAIVKGRVSYLDDPILGPTQRDEGGQARMVDLTDGSETLLIVSGRFFRRPTPSPQGDRMVAEAYVAIISSFPGGIEDTVISKTSDLWLFEVP